MTSKKSHVPMSLTTSEYAGFVKASENLRRAIAILQDVELCASVNCPINDGSPMHNAIRQFLEGVA